ncbi:MAG: hypothetical protein ACM3ON_01705 [Chloroflexota bacterium]|jgi:hypothetical protein
MKNSQGQNGIEMPDVPDARKDTFDVWKLSATVFEQIIESRNRLDLMYRREVAEIMKLTEADKSFLF